MGRTLLWLAMSGALFCAEAGTAFADGYGCGGSSPFGIERGVRQRGRVRFRTGCGGSTWGSSPFGITRGVSQGGRVRFRSGCGCDGGWGPARRTSYGTPWWRLRQNLAGSGSAIRYVYVRNYFFRRYPYLFAEGTPEDGEEITVDHYLHPQYDVAAHPLTTRQQLHLGAWQTWLGEYDAARASFEKVVAEDADHPEARWGLALCAVMGRDWKEAAKALDRVARLGELKVDDELLADDAFGEEGAIERVLKDVATATRYGFGDSDAHVVAAWLHVTQGHLRLASVHLDKARRGAPDSAAVASIATQLGGDVEAAPGAPEAPVELPGEPTTPTQVPTTDAGDRPTRVPVLVASR